MAGIPGRKAIVLMTDGVDQTSHLASLRSTLDHIAEQDVIVGERALRVRVRYPNLVVRARESHATSPTIVQQ
jgi:hypothetical protein